MALADQLNQTLKNRYIEAITLALNFFNTPCLYNFNSTKLVTCEACIARHSPNPYVNAGGVNNCPQCNNTGQVRKTVTISETGNIAVIFDYKKWIDVGGNVKSPDTKAQTICVYSNIHNINRCESIQFDTNIQPYDTYKFVRDGEVIPIGLGSHDFAICYWKIV
jgi:hypothetical protein